MPMFLSLLAGCSQPLSDFTLRLTPILLESQREDLLALEPDIFVQVTYPDGAEEVWYAGTASEGAALQLDGLPPLPTGSKVALVAVLPQESKEEWSRTDAIAYGEATLDQELATGEQEVELAVPLERVDDIAKRGAFRGADRKMGAAVAMLPGSIYLFGGGDPETTDALQDENLGFPRLISSDTVMKATRTAEGWSEFTEVGKIVPFDTELGFPGAYEDWVADRRLGMTSTPVTVDGKQAILVAGGRPTEFTAYFTDGWFLWDPETDKLFDGDNTGKLDVARSDHMAFPLGGSKVLLYGGQLLVNDGYPVIEIWDGQTRRSKLIDETDDVVDLGGVGAAASPVGTDVVVCGGLRVNFDVMDAHQWDPQKGCYRFAPNGRVSDVAPLPVALSGAAMAGLPDGSILVTGGSDSSFSEISYGSVIIIGTAAMAESLRKSYLWNPGTNTWTEVGNLVYPRSNHRMVTLSNGKVMVIGGTEGTSAFLSPYGETVRCIEIYSPESHTFEASNCTDVGQGAFPGAASDGREVGVLEGFLQSPAALANGGGGNYGSIRLIPE
jgi:hypothetical protein